MDQFKRSYYELAFENLYLKKRGSAFQDFFSEIMEKCHPGDFQLFNDHPNPTYGDEVASAFKNEYKKYKMLVADPDSIFCRLQEFAGGSERGTPAYEAAVLAVLTYLFEQCDIFERPPEEVPS